MGTFTSFFYIYSGTLLATSLCSMRSHAAATCSLWLCWLSNLGSASASASARGLQDSMYRLRISQTITYDLSFHLAKGILRRNRKRMDHLLWFLWLPVCGDCRFYACRLELNLGPWRWGHWLFLFHGGHSKILGVKLASGSSIVSAHNL